MTAGISAHPGSGSAARYMSYRTPGRGFAVYFMRLVRPTATASDQKGKYKSYSYRFETPGRVVVFTGDTGPSDKVAELAQNADILVSEVGSADDVKQLLIKNGTWQNMSAEQQTDVMRHLTEEHLTPAEVGKLAARAKAGKVVLTHLLPSVNDNDDYARFIPEVRQFFSGDVVIAKDLMEF